LRIANLVRISQQNGELRKIIDPDAVAVVIISSLEGALMIGGLEKTRQPLHIVGEHLKDYLLGLRTAASGGG
jgi:hypothetical protein